MKNSVQPGNTLDVVAPNDVTSGLGVRIGSIFGVAFASKLSGEVVAIGVEGVYDVAKLSTDAMNVGDKVNWNNTTKQLQLAAGDLDGVGTVVEAAPNPSASVKVKLTPL